MNSHDGALLLFTGLVNLLCVRNAAALSTTSSSSASANDAKQVVVIVGAGVGGLATAARLGSSTTHVEVHMLEQNAVPGGRCGSFWHRKGQYRHERGPSLLLLPDVYEELFQDVAGMSAAEFGLQMEPCVPAYQAIFEDGETIQLGFPDGRSVPDDEDVDRLRQQAKHMQDRWEDDGAAKWEDYLSICQAYLDAGFPNFIEERLDLSSLPKFVEVCFRRFGQAWPLQPHSDLLDSLFESPKLKALASFQDLYVGLEPYKNKDLPFGGVLTSTAPAVFGLLSAIEFQEGVYAPIGGFEAVTSALERLATSSGSTTIHYETSVTSVHDDGVQYVDHKTNTSHFLAADLVIVNADLPYAEASLCKDDSGSSSSTESTKQIFDWNDDYRFSSGVIAFHWSLNVALRDRLCTHNVFLAASNRSVAEQSWSALRDNTRSVAKPFNFYVHCASRTDPTAAPKDGESILVLVPCETLQRATACADMPRDEALQVYAQQFDTAYIDSVRKAVLERMQTVVSFDASNIIEESVDTPASFTSDYNLAAGTPFGISHGFGQLSFFRPAPSKPLYVGASTRPGNGVPLVLVGARRIAGEATRRLVAMKKD